MIGARIRDKLHRELRLMSLSAHCCQLGLDHAWLESSRGRRGGEFYRHLSLSNLYLYTIILHTLSSVYHWKTRGNPDVIVYQLKKKKKGLV